MTKQKLDEHITLYSPQYSEQAEEISLDKVTLELLQTSKLREHQKLFRIFDDQFLNLNEITAGKASSFSIRLNLLDETPVRKWFIKFSHLLFAILSFLLAWLTFELMQKNIAFFNTPNIYASITLLITAGAILMVYMVKNTRHVLIFKSKHGQVPVAELMYNNPDKRRFRQFARELSKLIAQCQTQNYYTDSQILAAELSEHRRLRNEGALTDKVYEQAKHHIMTYHSRPALRQASDTVH